MTNKHLDFEYDTRVKCSHMIIKIELRHDDRALFTMFCHLTFFLPKTYIVPTYMRNIITHLIIEWFYVKLIGM